MTYTVMSRDLYDNMDKKDSPENTQQPQHRHEITLDVPYK